MFQKAQLPSPPCRLTTEFLATLFKNRKFAQYFLSFVESGQMLEVLMQRSSQELHNFILNYHQIAKDFEHLD